MKVNDDFVRPKLFVKTKTVLQKHASREVFSFLKIIYKENVVHQNMKVVKKT